MEALDHRKLLANDPKMTEAFVACIHRYVHRFFMRDSQVHDVSQATMIEILGKLGQGLEPPPDHVHQWVLNCASNAVRRELTRVRREIVSYESRLHTRAQSSESQILSARQQLAQVDALLRECGDTTREVLLATVAGDTPREIAESLGTSPGAVRMTISRARAQLRDSLTAQERLDRLRWLAQHVGHGRTSLFKGMPSSSSS